MSSSAPVIGTPVGSPKHGTKPEDFQHPQQEQLPGIKYSVNDNPPWPETILLAFQHYLTMLGSTVMIPSLLVPMMGGNNVDKAKVIQTLLFVSGLNTLLQTTFGTRLPSVVGGSFAFIIPTVTVIHSPKLMAIQDNQLRFMHSMRAIQGALISASSLHIVLGFSGLWGIMTRYVSPIVIAPTICMVGLGLYEYGFPGVGKCVEIGIPTIFIIVIFSQFLKHIRVRDIPIFELYPIILGVAVTWAYAHLLTVSGAYTHATPMGQRHCRTDRAHIIGSAPWIRIPWPLQWGAPTFDAGHTFGMMAGALAALVESTGDFYALSRLCGATPPPPYVVSRGIGWEGLGILMDGMFGTTIGSAVSAENMGIIGVTKVGSRRVVQISAGFMLFFSLLGKFGGIFASIPEPMISGVFCVMFGIIAAIGISSLQFANMNSSRNIFIIGFALFMGLSVPRYFSEYETASGHGPAHTHARWFNDIMNTMFASGTTVVVVITVVLDNTMKASRKDRGLLWWDKFRAFGADSRNLEFYKLPLGLNKFFPPPQDQQPSPVPPQPTVLNDAHTLTVLEE
ncbi:hypothetical protein Mp_6g08300 [Marchantia polymorpha subsp. ruderalis]|uniref:Uncharacterized protein n=2 Tax=Marchantia polymorpha TaxID=3197 RepID=A0AAF6BPU2_MARPO|nr:hypothetical protein MARPO_0060s0091 [Marchantia polymorpha]BBN14026.1 hypothetical protein Mp_6g08300 [Marchantia polymorpha subsp. ruderalis]|eukprot:PTQ37019.1 hypothetical protein MARPO_0060s0091 [Marchantia polymorpha]